MTARSYSGTAAMERAAAPSAFSQMWSRNAPGYMFLIPWFIGFFGLTLGPILTSLYLSFTDFDLLTPARWNAGANYVRIFTADPKFAQSMKVTLFFVLFSVPL